MATSAEMKIRVWVTDVWDAVELPVTSDHTFAQVKAESLRLATGRAVDPKGYELKFRGAQVLDEAQTLQALDVPDGAPMIVLPARRQPVR